MHNLSTTLIDLETKFWPSMVDQDTDVALPLLCEPALMVSAHGKMMFDHAGYRQMADQGASVLTAFEISDMEVMFPNHSTAVLAYRVKQTIAKRGEGAAIENEMYDTSTWVKTANTWRCAIHTESPIAAR